MQNKLTHENSQIKITNHISVNLALPFQWFIINKRPSPPPHTHTYGSYTRKSDFSLGWSVSLKNYILKRTSLKQTVYEAKNSLSNLNLKQAGRKALLKVYVHVLLYNISP
jgi:hypothetical protein